jgi:GntR family transcriptional repressor for pyruvate dehydrogenase complex
MELIPIRPPRVVEAVAEQLEGQILDGTVAVGSKLPSEEQLAVQMGVGRRAVREALKVLETKGLVETQMGIGTVVCRNDLDSFLDSLAQNISSYLQLHRAEAKHVMQLRGLLEGRALGQLAENPNSERLQCLEEAVARQRQAHEARDYQEYQVWHFRFHQQIVDVLKNPLISMIYEQVMSLMREPMERSGSHPNRTEQSICDHEQILEALQRGARDELKKLLHCHLEGFVSHMQDE